MRKSYQYFAGVKHPQWENECLNIYFLLKIAGIDLVKREPAWGGDYRVLFIDSIKNDVKFENDGQAQVRKLCKQEKFQQATTLLVTWGLRCWGSRELNEIDNLCVFISGLPAVKAEIHVLLTSRGKCQTKIEQHIYFLTHYLLVVFKYGVTPSKIPTSQQLIVKDLICRLSSPWDTLLNSPRRDLNAELCFELFWVTLLASKNLEDLVLPDRYFTFLFPQTLKLLFKPLDGVKNIKLAKRYFAFYHKVYHQSILATILLQEIYGNSLEVEFT